MTMFDDEVKSRLQTFREDEALTSAAQAFMEASTGPRYCYNFYWMGRPIIQYPQDIQAMQELVWKVRPDLVIETGIAHGGSLILSASLLAMLDLVDATEAGTLLDPAKPARRVLGIDIDIREHNRKAIIEHPMANRIDMIEGSSIDPDVVARVTEIASGYERVLVCLDSNHTHEHVLAELEAYAPLTSVGSYCVVFDTIVEDLPRGTYPNRPWDKGNNPKTAVWQYVASHPEFRVDVDMHTKLLITVNPDGFLERIR